MNDDLYEESLSIEDREFLAGYKAGIGETVFPDAEEVAFLLEEGTAKKNQLMDMVIPMALEAALDYTGQGLPLSDLVQEGNLGLMQAVDNLYSSPCMDPDGILPFLRGEICNAIEAALLLDRDANETGEMVAERLNKLSDQIKELTEELGETPSISELSIYLEMPVEEIEALIRLTGEGSDDEGTEAAYKAEE